MNAITRPTVVFLLLLTTLTATTVAQQKRQTPARPQPKPAVAPAPTFDTLVPAESYTIYGEVRGVGQLIRSNALNEILEPVLKLAGPPREFKNIVKWLTAHADEIMTSRLLVATWPIAADVPQAIVAIEFASAEEAAKFAAPLNQILPTVLPPVMEASPEAQGENAKTGEPAKTATLQPKPSYHLQQAGSLILLTPTPLTLKKLKPAGSKPLAEDHNFRAARNRFNSEPVFVFIDLKMIERQEEERRKQAEAARRRLEAEAQAKLKKAEEPAEPQSEEEQKEEVQTGLVAQVTPPPEPVKPTPLDALSGAFTMVGSSFVSAESDWPDAVGLALSFEGDSFDVRALLVNPPGEKSDTVPFVPLLIPGPAFVPESPNILPADTELFATMSLDLPQIYATMSKPRTNAMYYTSRGNVQNVNEVVFESPFAAIEKQLKINLKDDLLPLLGSEIALRLPVTGFDVFGLTRGQAPNPKENSTNQQTSPVVLISLRDKEGMRALMPKLVEAIGFKGASAFAQTERRDDTELVSYVNLFSYAFIGNFLVFSPDPATTRHVVDSYLKHETLAGDPNFKTYTRWQPRPAHGLLYISPTLMQSYKSWIERPSTPMSDQTRAFLMRLTAVSQPITYSLSNEGFGPLHEAHFPKNLVLMAVAGIASETNPTPMLRNEGMARGLCHAIAHSEEQYKKDKGDGSYGTLEQLIAADMISKEVIENSGYKFAMTVTGDKFELFAVPVEYGKTGNVSYFIDQTRVLRGVDRNGAPASSSDPPIY